MSFDQWLECLLRCPDRGQTVEWSVGYHDGLNGLPQILPNACIVDYLKGYDEGWLDRVEDARHA